MKRKIAAGVLERYFLYAIVAATLFGQTSCKKELTEYQPPTKYNSPVVSRNSGAGRNSNLTDMAATEKTIQFSGLTWVVRANAASGGPGPNSWSADNAWVDPQGKLHLTLTKDPISGKWMCAEVYTKNLFGSGKYQFQVEGRVDQLDKNVVFGLFNYSGNDGYDEMDIEFSRWGSDLNPMLNYAVWPKTKSTGAIWTTSKDFSLTGTYSTHRFTRLKSSVKFQSLHGFQSGNTGEFYSSTCADATIVSTLQMPVHINLWLFRGVAPSNDTPVELVVHNFTFTR